MKAFNLLSVLTTTTILSVAAFANAAEPVESFGAIQAVSTITSTTTNTVLTAAEVKALLGTKPACDVVGGYITTAVDCTLTIAQKAEVDRQAKADAAAKAKADAALAAQAVKDQTTAAALAKTNAANAAKLLITAQSAVTTLVNQIKPLQTTATNAQVAMEKAQKAYNDKACTAGSTVAACKTLQTTLSKAIETNTAAIKSLTDKQNATAAANTKAQADLAAAMDADAKAKAANTKAAADSKAATDAKVAADKKVIDDTKAATTAAALAKLIQDHIDAAVKAADAAYAKASATYIGKKTVEEGLGALQGLYDKYSGSNDNESMRNTIFQVQTNAQQAAADAYIKTLTALEKTKSTGLSLTAPSKYLAGVPKPVAASLIYILNDADGNMVLSGNPTAEAAAKAAIQANAAAPALNQFDPVRVAAETAMRNSGGPAVAVANAIKRMENYFNSALYTSDAQKVKDLKVKLAYAESIAQQYPNARNKAAVENIKNGIISAQGDIIKMSKNSNSDAFVNKFKADMELKAKTPAQLNAEKVAEALKTANAKALNDAKYVKYEALQIAKTAQENAMKTIGKPLYDYYTKNPVIIRINGQLVTVDYYISNEGVPVVNFSGEKNGEESLGVFVYRMTGRLIQMPSVTDEMMAARKQIGEAGLIAAAASVPLTFSDSDTVESLAKQAIAAKAQAILYTEVANYYKQCSTEALAATAACTTIAANFALDMTAAKAGYLGAIVAVNSDSNSTTTNANNTTSAAHSAALIAAITGNTGATGAAGAVGAAGQTGVAGQTGSTSGSVIVFPFLPNSAYQPPVESNFSPKFILDYKAIEGNAPANTTVTSVKIDPYTNILRNSPINDLPRLQDLYHSDIKLKQPTPDEMRVIVDDIVDKAMYADGKGGWIPESDVSILEAREELRRQLYDETNFEKMTLGQADSLVELHKAINSGRIEFVITPNPEQHPGYIPTENRIVIAPKFTTVSVLDQVVHEAGHFATEVNSPNGYPANAFGIDYFMPQNTLHEELRQILRETSTQSAEQAWALLNERYGAGFAARTGNVKDNLIASAGIPENLTAAQKIELVYRMAWDDSGAYAGNMQSTEIQTKIVELVKTFAPDYTGKPLIEPTGGVDMASVKGSVNLGVLTDLFNSGKSVKPVVETPHVAESALATKGGMALGIFGAYSAFTELSQGYQTGDNTHMISGGANLLDAIAGLSNSRFAGPTGIVAGAVNMYTAYNDPNGVNVLAMTGGGGQVLLGSAVSIQMLASTGAITLSAESAALVAGAATAGTVVLIAVTAAHATNDILKIISLKVGLEEAKAELDKDAQAKLGQSGTARDGSGKPDVTAYSHLLGISYLNTGTGLSTDAALAAIGVRLVEDPALIQQKLDARRAEIANMQDDRSFMEKMWGGINPVELAQKELAAAEAEFAEYKARLTAWKATNPHVTLNASANGGSTPFVSTVTSLQIGALGTSTNTNGPATTIGINGNTISNTLGIGTLGTSINTNGPATTTGINGNTITNTLGIGVLQPATGGLNYVYKGLETPCLSGLITREVTHSYDYWTKDETPMVTVKLWVNDLCEGSPLPHDPSANYETGAWLQKEDSVPYDWTAANPAPLPTFGSIVNTTAQVVGPTTTTSSGTGTSTTTSSGATASSGSTTPRLTYTLPTGGIIASADMPTSHCYSITGIMLNFTGQTCIASN